MASYQSIDKPSVRLYGQSYIGTADTMGIQETPYRLFAPWQTPSSLSDKRVLDASNVDWLRTAGTRAHQNDTCLILPPRVAFYLALCFILTLPLCLCFQFFISFGLYVLHRFWVYTLTDGLFPHYGFM